MDKQAKSYVAGHRGMLGSAIVRGLQANGDGNIISGTHQELDLLDRGAVNAFIQQEKSDYAFLAAAKVGGIQANKVYRADFIDQDLMIEANLLPAANRADLSRLQFLGSSCICPKLALYPMKEEYLLAGPIEPTNRPHALAKIAAIEISWSLNRQYDTKYLPMMTSNPYGPGDNHHPESGHVTPALIRKFHEAKQTNATEVIAWCTGTPKREFLYSESMAADACALLMNLPDEKYDSLLGSDESKAVKFEPPLVNVGVGTDASIKELGESVKPTVGFHGGIALDPSKPDGTPRKLLHVRRLDLMEWVSKTAMLAGLSVGYQNFISG